MSNAHDDAIHAKIAAEAAERNLRAAIQRIDALEARLFAAEKRLERLAGDVSNNTTQTRANLQIFAAQESRIAGVEAFRSDIERWRQEETHGALR